MIKSKKDLNFYLQEDKNSLGIKKERTPIINRNLVWRFQIILRKHEYYANIEHKKQY